MRITLLVVGKTDSRPVADLTAVYIERLKHYIPFDMQIIPDVKKSARMDEQTQKRSEGQEILKALTPSDTIILLDENGKQYSSMEYASLLQKYMLSGIKRLVFIVGGPYGFSDEVYKRADGKISLSKMTFSHQMIRPFITEQIYRAYTILNNEPYHHA